MRLQRVHSAKLVQITVLRIQHSECVRIVGSNQAGDVATQHLSKISLD